MENTSKMQIPAKVSTNSNILLINSNQLRNNSAFENFASFISPPSEKEKRNTNIKTNNLLKVMETIKTSNKKLKSDNLLHQNNSLKFNFKRRIAFIQSSNNCNFLGTSSDLNFGSNDMSNNNLITIDSNNLDNTNANKKSSLYQRAKIAYAKYYNSNVNHWINLIVLILALLSQDIKIIALPPKCDKGFEVFYFILITLLFLGFIVDTFFLANYFLSFECVFDLVSTISMIFENESIYQGYSFLKMKVEGKRTPFFDINKLELFIRIMRVLKLTSIVKIYNLSMDIMHYYEEKRMIVKREERKQKKIERKRKNDAKKKSKRASVKENSTLQPFPINSYSNNTNSNTALPEVNTNNNIQRINLLNQNIVLKQLSKKTDEASSNILNKISVSQSEKETKIFEENRDKRINKLLLNRLNEKIILIIYVLSLMAIFTEDNLYKNSSNFTYYSIPKMLDYFLDTYENDISDQAIDIYATYERYVKNMSTFYYPIINVTKVNNDFSVYTFYQNESYANKKLRYEEVGYTQYSAKGSIIAFSVRKKVVTRSIILISRMIYIYLLIVILTKILRNLCNKLLLNPIEDMIKIVDLVAKDPVNSKTIEDLKKDCIKSLDNSSKKNSNDYEIKIIQFAIIRISALMAIGFGEAGGEILKENIQSSEGLNPMLEGKKITAIFGFCYIRHFPEINETLQEKTMIFVNQISEIVHSAVDKFGGITNKNLGDCFLLVWKFKEESILNSQRNLLNSNLQRISSRPKTIEEEERSCYVSDCALLAFLSIIKKINKNRTILSYRNNAALQEKLGKNFKVQMGFGLHLGWGIEGAIGSYYKIDCSYLSPNVNIAARLETATNIYGVDILFSGEFYDTLSTYMKHYCRKIDCVALKGCVNAVNLYTVDVNTNIRPGKEKPDNKKMNIRERRMKKMKLKNRYELHTNKTIGEVYIGKSKGMKHLLKKPKNETFLNYFDEGFMYYINGDWKEAYEELKNALFLDKNDGPTKTLLRYIKKYNKIAPSDWDGYRKLEAKS